MIDEGGNVTMHVDGSHAMHEDGKAHSGLFATMGKGAMINISKKLGLVTTSSAEKEIASTGERHPKCAYFRHFRMDQGGCCEGWLIVSR